MLLSVGNKIVYPHQGPCLIGAVVQKVVGGRPTSFYQLADSTISAERCLSP